MCPPKLMNSIHVDLGYRKLEVKKLPLRKYADLLKVLKRLPKILESWSGLSNDQIFEKLPIAIGEFYPDFVELMTVATELTREEIENDNFGLAEATKTVVAVFQINDYSAVYEEIKKVYRPSQNLKLNK